jgi:hypothetical protein
MAEACTASCGWVAFAFVLTPKAAESGAPWLFETVWCVATSRRAMATECGGAWGARC